MHNGETNSPAGCRARCKKELPQPRQQRTHLFQQWTHHVFFSLFFVNNGPTLFLSTVDPPFFFLFIANLGPIFFVFLPTADPSFLSTLDPPSARRSFATVAHGRPESAVAKVNIISYCEDGLSDRKFPDFFIYMVVKRKKQGQ